MFSFRSLLIVGTVVPVFGFLAYSFFKSKNDRSETNYIEDRMHRRSLGARFFDTVFNFPSPDLDFMARYSICSEGDFPIKDDYNCIVFEPYEWRTLNDTRTRDLIERVWKEFNGSDYSGGDITKLFIHDGFKILYVINMRNFSDGFVVYYKCDDVICKNANVKPAKR